MTKNLDKNKVLLGLSGGVDSAAAAIILKNLGFDVTGYYFDIIGDQKGYAEVERLAEQLGIDLIKEDVSDLFSNIVISDFCNEYISGHTPNPCIICNPSVKFKKLIENADQIGAYHIATGHYCRIKDGHLQMAANISKDQSYMLYRLTNDIIERLIFPLGDSLSKDDIRSLAKDYKLDNAEKKDSLEICFVDNDDNYVDYLERKGFISESGSFVDKEGNILGRHKGIVNYTIGQRKGLGIALGKPAFVTGIDRKSNEITLGDNEDLFSDIVFSKDNVFVSGDYKKFENDVLTAKIRYAAKPMECTVRFEDDTVITFFKDKQRAITPGQSIVFYKDDIVIGGGIIKEQTED